LGVAPQLQAELKQASNVYRLFPVKDLEVAYDWPLKQLLSA